MVLDSWSSECKQSFNLGLLLCDTLYKEFQHFSPRPVLSITISQKFLDAKAAKTVSRVGTHINPSAGTAKMWRLIVDLFSALYESTVYKCILLQNLAIKPIYKTSINILIYCWEELEFSLILDKQLQTFSVIITSSIQPSVAEGIDDVLLTL